VNTPNAGTLFSDGFESATHCRRHEPETAHTHSGSYEAEESTTGASHICTHMPKGPLRVLKFEYVTFASNADRAMKVLRSLLERCCYIGVRANMS